MSDELASLRQDNQRLMSARRLLLDTSTWMTEEDVDDLHKRYGSARPMWLVAFRYRSGAVTEYNRLTGKWRAGVVGTDELFIVCDGKTFGSESEARVVATKAANKIAGGASLKEVGAL